LAPGEGELLAHVGRAARDEQAPEMSGDTIIALAIIFGAVVVSVVIVVVGLGRRK
jgi:hypothetical protein